MKDGRQKKNLFLRGFLFDLGMILAPSLQNHTGLHESIIMEVGIWCWCMDFVIVHFI